MKKITLAFSLLAACQLAQGADIKLSKTTFKSGDVEVPASIATPPGKGPFPPVLYIHAKRGYDEVDQRHITTLAKQGFLVLAPDWQSGRFIERWPAAHDPGTENDIEAGLNALKALPGACSIPAGVVGYSTRVGWFAGGLLCGRSSGSQRLGSIGRRCRALFDAVFQSRAVS